MKRRRNKCHPEPVEGSQLYFFVILSEVEKSQPLKNYFSKICQGFVTSLQNHVIMSLRTGWGGSPRRGVNFCINFAYQNQVKIILKIKI